MNELERRLIELKSHRIQLKGLVSGNEVSNSSNSLMFGSPIDDIDDIYNVSYTSTDCVNPDPQPEKPCGCNAIAVTEDYEATPQDCYIGCRNPEPMTLRLPNSSSLIVVKDELGPPVGNRKITILPPNGSTIDQKDQVVIQSPYEVVRLIFREGNWFMI